MPVSDLFWTVVMEQTKSSGSDSSFFANAFGLVKQTGKEFLEDKAPQLGAALAYYTVFSLAPLDSRYPRGHRDHFPQ